MDILLWPHPSLKRVCAPVELNDPDVRAQLQEMKKLMNAANGLGLAANQVGLNKRMLVALDRFFVNPKIVGHAGAWRKVSEGCLSVPGVIESVARSESVLVESQDLETGVVTVSTFSGSLGHVLQHEIEHLDGIMFLDKLPAGKRDLIRAGLRRGRR